MESVKFVEKFLVYIEDHLRHDLDLNAIYNSLHVEPKSFSVIFQSLVGMTPHDYQERRRMTEIAYEIVQGHRRLIDICKYYGYKDLEEFKQIYKHTLNISPYETEKHIHELPLQHPISFEVVPTEEKITSMRYEYVDGIRLIGISQTFDVNDYEINLKIDFLKYLNENGLIDEILKYQSGIYSGIIIYERNIEDSIELMVGVNSHLNSPFDETFIPTSNYAIFTENGNLSHQLNHIYKYIFRRWRFNESVELNCSYSIEMIENFKMDFDEEITLQVWQPLYD